MMIKDPAAIIGNALGALLYRNNSTVIKTEFPAVIRSTTALTSFTASMNSNKNAFKIPPFSKGVTMPRNVVNQDAPLILDASSSSSEMVINAEDIIRVP